MLQKQNKLDPMGASRLMKTLRRLIGILIVVAGVHVAWRVVPLYVAYFQLQGAMDDVVLAGTTDSRTSEGELRNKIYQEAQSLNIDLQPEQIQVQRTPFGVFVSANYTVHVGLPFCQFDLHFHPTSTNRRALM